MRGHAHCMHGACTSVCALRVQYCCMHVTKNRKVISEEGFLRLFRGLWAPLVGASLENMIVFWWYAAAERYLKSRHDGTSPLSIFEVGLAGGFSGVGTGMWLTC